MTTPLDEQRRYVEAIEGLLGRLRDRPLVLSPDDLEHALRWQREGIPLPLVLRAITEVFEKAAQRRPRRRPSSLRYCAHGVQEAWELFREIQAGGRGGHAALQDTSALFEDAARMLERSRAPGPARERALGALRELAAGTAALADVDPVGRIERELLAECELSLAAEERDEMAAVVARQVAPYEATMAAAMRERAARALAARWLRLRFALPDLSLLPPLPVAAPGRPPPSAKPVEPRRP
ncbi:MAG: hypothetical protein KBD01_10740 [Acidobacteria bacterium]|nr:hypothetical protein [Acidobacteriota bacterium]